MKKKRNNPETIAIHGGDYRSDPTTNAVAVMLQTISGVNGIRAPKFRK